MTGWRQSRAVALVVIAVFLTVQFVIPIARFGNHEVTQRFGWQMFAGFVPAPEIVVVTSQGEEPIALDEYMAWPRSDIDIIAYLPAHLCEVVPDARTVVWRNGSRQC
jgi:hypothetical protein